jgi:hypothetical protein
MSCRSGWLNSKHIEQYMQPYESPSYAFAYSWWEVIYTCFLNSPQVLKKLILLAHVEVRRLTANDQLFARSEASLCKH